MVAVIASAADGMMGGTVINAALVLVETAGAVALHRKDVA